jgi:presenilin-like A22 family membrane protease
MKRTETLLVSRVRGASLVKLIVLGYVIGSTFITSIFGIAALFGVEILQWNEQYVTGIKGLIASPFIGAVLGLFFGLFAVLFVYIGLKIYSFFRDLTLEYVPSKVTAAPGEAVGE